MLIIDQNLKSLVCNSNICNQSLVEDFCIQIRLSDIGYYKPKKRVKKTINYGIDNNNKLKDYFEEISKEPLVLAPGEQVLACSQDHYHIPNNVFGLVQTKGTLARLFVQITSCDGQIEPGFKGHITLEIINLSPYKISIPFRQKIGQLYLFSCSMSSTNPYNGKYASSNKPTLPTFFNL